MKGADELESDEYQSSRAAFHWRRGDETGAQKARKGAKRREKARKGAKRRETAHTCDSDSRASSVELLS